MIYGAPTNSDRANWAQVALDAFMQLGGTDECDGIPDLVTNLMHLQRRRDEATGKPFDAEEWAKARALMHDMEHEEDEEGDDDLAAAADGEDCTACHRPSIDCSRAPCAAVIADRGED